MDSYSYQEYLPDWWDSRDLECKQPMLVVKVSWVVGRLGSLDTQIYTQIHKETLRIYTGYPG